LKTENIESLAREKGPTYTPEKSAAKTTAASESKGAFSVPSIAVPKGGGAIRGIGEKFLTNAATGTASLTVPIRTSPGRQGFGPQLSLSYDSGSGNGPFGFGWSLSVPSITRKTDKGLPQYVDAADSDVFLLSGAEDLVPVLKKGADGDWKRDAGGNIVFDFEEKERNGYLIRLYRPRIEGLFARIERWTRKSDGDTHWRSISKDNILTVYGRDKQSRIYDPLDESRVFSWLMCESYDDKGNAILYEYVAENNEHVDLTQANERNRLRTANRYLKRIKYGNRKPLLLDFNVPTFRGSHLAQPDFALADWMFEVVFDYDEGHCINFPSDETPPKSEQHEYVQASASSTGKWHVRPDPFSTYRAGFEIRTYRRCVRVLMFHNFPELGNEPYLVGSTEFEYGDLDYEKPVAVEKELEHKGSTRFASFIQSVIQAGYKRETKPVNAVNGVNYFIYLKKSLPPLEFEYSHPTINEEIHAIDAASLENLPYGVDGSRYEFADLDGEGISGILTEQANAWFYKPNLGGKFGPMEKVAAKPSLASLRRGGMQLLDLAGDGQLDVVMLKGPVSGFYERTQNKNWDNFTPFTSLPNISWSDPNLRFIDLTGDGHADVMLTENEVFTWYPSLAEEGFDSAEKRPQSIDEEKGPRLVFNDGTQSIYLSSMSGSSLNDIVRVRNGEVCYWPNLGYGRFGAKVTMDDAPMFDAPDQFDQKRIRLADVNGSGVTDIIYLGCESVQIYFNHSGNSWSSARTLQSFPPVDNMSSVQIVDLRGNGTACLVWSSPLPGDSSLPMRYIDLMGGQKPHLLVGSKNNLGAETLIQYAASTKFYLADKEAGKPWITRLPFPVYVVERVETYDHISRNRFVTSYVYHHGYFDGIEREFRGFGRVEQKDTEEFGVLKDSDTFPPATNLDAASHVPPVLTETWFHNGAYLKGKRVSRHFENEYYQESDVSEHVKGLNREQMRAMLLDDTVVPETFRLSNGKQVPFVLSAVETREACRALKGSVLRQEVYALDGSEKEDRPYRVSERNYTIELVQPCGRDQHAVFFAHPRETIDFDYERKLYDNGAEKLADPRVSHSMTLDVDAFGNILLSVAIGYGRRYDNLDQSLTDEDKKKQNLTLVTFTENTYTNLVSEEDAYRTPLPSEMRTYQLLNTKPESKTPQVTNLFRFSEIGGKIKSASDGHHDQDYEKWAIDETTLVASWRRLIENIRTLYRRNDLSGPLALNELKSLALPYENYKLAFTETLLSSVYKRKFDNDPPEKLLPNPSPILGGKGSDGGGYVDLDGNGSWWIPSGKIFCDVNADEKNPAATAPAELGQASQHFFLPRKFADPFGHSSIVDYDLHDLLLVSLADAVNNIIRSDNDYRTLQPKVVVAPNKNRLQVVFDALGMVVGTAIAGKEIEPDGKQKGDLLDGFEPNLTQEQVNQFMAKPRVCGLNPGESVATQIVYDLLGKATSRIIYDVGRFKRSAKPPFTATVLRETHNSELQPSQRSKLQISFSFSDGFGREIQRKIAAEPGPLVEGGLSVSPRWVGSGWVVFNNKGKPIKNYEPFFDDEHDFRFGKKVGVSSTLFYDPVERVVATLHPNHTYEKVVFDPWYQETWDVNDTVNPTKAFDPAANVLPDSTFDPKHDPDVGDYFRRLSPDEFLPTWYNVRMDANKAVLKWPDADPVTNSPIPENAMIRDAEKSSAAKTARHAATPRRAYLDTLGRTFLTIADNGLGQDGKRQEFQTRVGLDIEGNQRKVTDAKIEPPTGKGRVIMLYDYDMLGNRIRQMSMDAGGRWTLNDALGKSIRTWDWRGHNFRMEYDMLRRPIRHFVRGTNAAHSDPDTLNNDVLFEKIEYGEGQANDVTLNLRTRVFMSYDGAGIATNVEYDFKGNLLRGNRKLTKEYKGVINWSNAVQTDRVFSNSTTYNALNRPVTLTTPDNSVFRPVYNEANLLNSIDVNLRGGQAGGQPTWTTFVANIEYDAKGQRTLITYGNGAETRYRYDAETFRLIHLYTRRGAEFTKDCGGDPPPPFSAPVKPPHSQPCGLQNIHYTYDPAGNITAIRDDAQQTLYFNGQVIRPDSEYAYDATYRLVEASGREHMGQAQQPHASWNDEFRVSLAHPNDGQKIRNYLESYEYDDVGNLVFFRHKANNGDWVREYRYDEASLIENNRKSNRLTLTFVHPNAPQPIQEPYSHDLHGNMTSMPHLQRMEWDFEDQLHHVDKGTEQIYYVYDASGQRARKVAEKNNGSLVEERIYLGGFEVFQQRDGAGAVNLERETLHIMDDKQRIAMVETRIQGNDPAPSRLVRYQFSNHLGSSNLELDDQAKIISYEEYYSYGSTSYQAVRSQTEIPKRYRLAAKERDEESGLYYFGARYYAPQICRWIAVDPAGIKKNINVYAYVSNRPIVLVDPDGRDEEPPEKWSFSSSKPGFGESIIPIWGSVRDANYNFGKGNWGWGLVYTGLAISDVFLIKSIATAIGKATLKTAAIEAAEKAAKEAAEKAAKEAAEKAAKEAAEKAAKEAAAKTAAEEALKVTGKVGYGATDLSKLAAEYRKAHKIATGNVAVFEYLEGGAKKTITRVSEQFVGHSEKLIAEQLKKMGIDPKNVTRIYSELQPCNYLFGGGCGRLIQETFTKAAVTYSFEYGATRASREAGVKLLKTATEQIFKPSLTINLLGR
jgi:RHS repeat-associated protein